MTFREYLEQKNLAERGIYRRIRLVERWLKYLPKSVEKTSYQDLLNYIEKLQREEKTISHINAVLLGVSDYYNYKQLPNLAINTRLKGATTKTLPNPLSRKELEQIYQSFEGDELEQVVLGLMIYQGLEQSDFITIETKDIDLSKGTIYIPSRKERQSRRLQLEAHQIMQLNNFLFSTESMNERTSKEAKYGSASSERTAKADGRDKAFSPFIDNPNHFNYLLRKLSKKLKHQIKEKLDIDIIKLSHLRQSRIAIWVKEEGIRQGQYKAGFRRVLSAEKYLRADLSNLRDQIKKHHPFK